MYCKLQPTFDDKIFVTAKDYGLFLADEDIKKGVWLEPGRNLDYYILRNGVNIYSYILPLLNITINIPMNLTNCYLYACSSVSLKDKVQSNC